MKFTIGVEDFWLEEEELTAALEAHIKHAVVSEISKSIKKQVETQITKRVNEVIKDKIDLVIDSTLTDLLASGMITVNSKDISIIEHVKSLFMRNHGWNNPDKQMKEIAKKFGEELKLQYNNVFANKIVLNMKEQGLLKDDVVKMLLGGE